ncbi:hypothetical protein OPHB3_2138 [Oceanobacillus picturae]|uniref:Uncharacterized protein n=1 Tax=Oceanobacillus picturae TaxID=171693 RepID=A0A0U9H643_9BACI|nr:hypothetical protein [Oceanobacillus picturae]GAQ18199.1 hypothetical protein OPHB3_2138 [Oceanobacillus picturae]
MNKDHQNKHAKATSRSKSGRETVMHKTDTTKFSSPEEARIQNKTNK